MKLATSLCFAASLLLTVNLPSSAQTQDRQDQAPAQSNKDNDQAQGQSQKGSQPQNADKQQDKAQSGKADQQQPGAKQNAQSSAADQSKQGLLLRNDANDNLNILVPNTNSQLQNIYYDLTGNHLSLLNAVNPSTGMSLAATDDSLREHLKLPKDQGLVVTSLDPNCSAAQAGIQQNDVLLKLDGFALAKPEDLDRRLKEIGEKPVYLTVMRGGKTYMLYVQPVIRVTLQRVQPKPPSRDFWIGVSVTQIDPALRSQLQLPNGRGLIVNGVEEGTPARKAGIKRHDIVLELDGKPMSEPAKLAEAVQAHGEKPVTMHLIREGRLDLEIAVTPERRKPADVSNRAADRNVVMYYALQPGAVLQDPVNHFYGGGTVTADLDGTGQVRTYQFQDPNRTLPHPVSADLSRRLDALDANLKELRQAVEELTKLSKAIRASDKDAANAVGEGAKK